MTDRASRSPLALVLTMLLAGCAVTAGPGDGALTGTGSTTGTVNAPDTVSTTGTNGTTGTSDTSADRPASPARGDGIPRSGTATAGEPPDRAATPRPPRGTATSQAAPAREPPAATPAPPPRVPEGLPTEWGVAFLSPGHEVTVLGTLHHGAAWSTIKVPLAVAALREHGDPVSAQARAALTWSDNGAAGQLWTGLGRPDVAGAAVDGVLRSLGDPATATQTQQVQPPFSPFGQTDWTLEGQVRAARGLSCAEDPAASAVLDLMGQVSPDQAWGLGTLDGARFKGGWGPGPDGRYLVRQLGLVHRGGQAYPVALAVRAEDGSFASGTAALDVLAGWWSEALVGQASPTGCAG